MPHARKPNGSGKTDQRSPRPRRAQPKSGRRQVVRASQDVAEVGAKSPLSPGPNPHEALADPVPAAKPAIFLFDVQGVRVVGEPQAPWFVAKDVCAALEIANSRDALASLEEDEKGVAITDTLGGPQKFSTINESGLYALIFRSRKPVARLFRRWVTGEVLPAIRQRGHYGQPAKPLPAPRIEIHQRPRLPAPPTEETRVCELLAHLLGTRERAMVTAAMIGHVAVREELFPLWIQDETHQQQRARLMRNLVRYYGRWLSPAPDAGWHYLIQPAGEGKTRRYHLTRRSAPPLSPMITLADDRARAIEIVEHALARGSEVAV